MIQNVNCKSPGQQLETNYACIGEFMDMVQTKT